jgi:hypothetical protein
VTSQAPPGSRILILEPGGDQPGASGLQDQDEVTRRVDQRAHRQHQAGESAPACRKRVLAQQQRDRDLQEAHRQHDGLRMTRSHPYAAGNGCRVTLTQRPGVESDRHAEPGQEQQPTQALVPEAGHVMNLPI